MIGLTARQRDCAQFISEFVRARGYSPSFEEIANGLGCRSRGNVHRLVAALRERGVLENVPGRARSIGVVGERMPVRPQTMEALRRFAGEIGRTPEAILNEVLVDYLGLEDGGVVG